ncbi:Palmitoyltransferase [Fasciola gigantica]|uniref:Palmitoyltransferase n=1 Tax=Fasciola gigantica TaxID=46835 RepID=A0A504Z0K1_FASGI|nr:Palmitoyltransferase [Fasciola gigantica]
MVFRCDACGIVCVFFTYLLVIYSDYVVVFHLIRPVLKSSLSAIFNTVAFNLVVFLLGLSHLCAVLADPGVVPLGRYPLTQNGALKRPSGWDACTRCAIYRPPRSHHCRVCRRCIRRMDHHCPWINNCVGEYNQKYFILFLVYVGALCIHALVLVVVCRAVINGETNHSDSEADAIVVAHTVILVAICCLFGLFVLAIFSDQMKSIMDDETAVESAKNRARSRRRAAGDPEMGDTTRQSLSRMDLFREVFGPGPVYLWLLPCHHLFQPRPPDSDLEGVVDDELQTHELHIRPAITSGTPPEPSETDSSSISF